MMSEWPMWMSLLINFSKKSMNLTRRLPIFSRSSEQ